MTPLIGFISLVLLLAFSLVVFAVASAAFCTIREGHVVALRGPAAVFLAAIAVIVASFLTLARWLFVQGIGSIAFLADWTVQIVRAYPTSWICLGPALLLLVVIAAAPGSRKWIADNYLAISVIILATAAIGGAAFALISFGGGWSIIALLIGLGVTLGLGKQGLVFVPHLDDGPRVGEKAAAALPRMLAARARRMVYQAPGFLSAALQQVFTKEVALTVLIIVVMAGIWLAYSNRPAVSPPVPEAVSAASPAIEPPTATAPPATPTQARQLVAYQVAHTDKEGVLLREQAGRNGKALLSIPEGATVEPVGSEIVEVEGINWCKVKESGGTIGWTATQYLEPIYSLGSVKLANTGGEGVFLRAKPGKSGGTFGVVQEGEQFMIIGPDAQADGKTWRNVRNAKGSTGWISDEYLAPMKQ